MLPWMHRLVQLQLLRYICGRRNPNDDYIFQVVEEIGLVELFSFDVMMLIYVLS